MFPTLRSSAPALVLAALIGGAALAVPTPARAGDHSGAGPAEPGRCKGHICGRESAARRSGPTAAARDVVDGERALLNRSRAEEYPLVPPRAGDEPAEVDGPYVARVRALLNRASL